MGYGFWTRINAGISRYGPGMVLAQIPLKIQT